MRRLIFPVMAFVFVLMMFASMYAPRLFAAGSVVVFFVAAVLCTILSVLALLYAS